MDENATQLAFKAGDDKRYESRRKRNAVGNNEEYHVGGIQDSAVYARESESDHLPELFSLVSCKGYPEEENTWECYDLILPNLLYSSPWHGTPFPCPLYLVLAHSCISFYTFYFSRVHSSAVQLLVT